MAFFHCLVHLRGQLRGINLDGSGNPVPNASQGDLFSYRLDYETAFIYDGNIGKQSWQASNNNAPSGLRAYTFTYDNISRLKSATYSGVGSENYSLPTINYDRNGNITSMQRNGKLSSGYGLMDNLTYTYSGNRLMRVEDAVSGNYDVDFVNRNNGTDDYSYYANGALKADKNEEITDIIYSTYANQPIEIQLTGSRWIKNFYDGAGRLYKTSYSTGEYWEYLDGMVFKNGAFYQLATPEGRANYQSGAWGYEYFLTDHLGNTRVAYKATGSALTKTSETSFDPWGVVLNGINQVNSFQNRFEFLNREKESTFNLNLIRLGTRGYNPTIGRFDRTDPVIEGQEQFSLYQYGWNNPVLRSDPDGNLPVLPWLDAVVDVAFVVYDAAVLIHEKVTTGKTSKENWAALGADGVSIAIPMSVGAGMAVKAVMKTANKVDNAVDVAKTADKAGDAMKNRVKLQKGTKEAVKEAAPKTKEGKFIDPNTGKPIEKGQEVYGHKTGKEWSKYKKDPANQGKTRKEVIKDQNDPKIYQIEDKKSNASHKYEEKH